MLVNGEAGVGKTALVRRFCANQGGAARVLWGTCDALFAPRPLGPLFDVAEETGGELEELVQTGARPHEVVAALVRELGSRGPTVLVLEDVHWADEAALDVVRMLARRVQTVAALVIATYRDDELDRGQALRIVLGDLATDRTVTRLSLAPLSPDAVAGLASEHGVDADELYRKTAGNPFFVTEVLAARGDEIPGTVRDAVFARAARLSAPARALLDAVAAVPPRAELWLLEGLAADAFGKLDECLVSGVLTADVRAVAFRHELARRAVEESLAPDRRLALHRAALALLADPPGGAPDHARLAHHAEAAGDAEAVLRYAPEAGARAAAAGAHRAAAAQYARALRFADAGPARAELLERRAYECYLTGQFGEGVAAQESAVEAFRELGDVRKEGDSLRSLARLLGFVGRTDEAAAACRAAVALLERLPPGRELGMAYGKLAQRSMNWEDSEATIAWGTRAIELAEELDDTEILVYALVSVGRAQWMSGAPEEGRAKLERGLELARQAGLEDHVGRAFVNLAWLVTRQRSYAEAASYLDAGLEYSAERGLDLWRLTLLGCHARVQRDQGHWSQAADTAEAILRDPRRWPVPRLLALVVLGLVRARRGDPDVWGPLDAALAWAQPTKELQLVAPAAAARAEAAWLEGRGEEAAAAAEVGLGLALRAGASWEIGELACWRRRAGVEEQTPSGAAEPYALEMAGEPARAAEMWARIGCPYEAALARAQADDEDTLRAALDELQRLGAAPAAAIVARRLRERGARGLPKGPRKATRQNPAQLTARELEVLELVAQGLGNAAIAERLFLSQKTVAHHVSSILRKLDARTRAQATAKAVRLGLAAEDR